MEPDRGRSRGAQFVQGSLRHEFAYAHDTHMGAHLFHFREEVAGDEHGGAPGGEGADQAAHLPGPLRIQAVGGFIEDKQFPRPQQGMCNSQPLLHPERIGAHLFARGMGQPHPLERFIHPCGPGPRGCVKIGAVQSPKVRRPGQERVEGRPSTSEPTLGRTVASWRGISPPRTRMRPFVAAANPSSNRMVVVLPEPFGPRKPKTEPRGTAKSTPSTAAGDQSAC
ncbi:hypothetical protein AHiyo8_62140 [Arthrobacter sp. Hiyo8]|nr:hypothetical protein AHiyo8_62140 [Arthrobacter sp. Hiyo8]